MPPLCKAVADTYLCFDVQAERSEPLAQPIDVNMQTLGIERAVDDVSPTRTQKELGRDG
ncbi:MAG: hypothetical protein QOJ64_3217 [Acidobacteriota bacterium]|jgi:hypothetical protein|nr:hypothetical protein [Acidobacteriota bacterium]